MIVNPVSFMIVALAVWRITHMVNEEDGPFDVIVKLRMKLGTEYDWENNEVGTTWISTGVLCHMCVSFWVGLLGALVLVNPANVLTFFVVGLALSAMSCFINSAFSE